MFQRYDRIRQRCDRIVQRYDRNFIFTISIHIRLQTLWGGGGAVRHLPSRWASNSGCARVPVAAAHADDVHLSSQSGHEEEAVDRQLDVLHRTVRVLAVRVERGQGGGHGAQHAHRVCPERESIEEPLHVLVHKGVHLDAALEPVETLLVRQVAVDEE